MATNGSPRVWRGALWSAAAVLGFGALAGCTKAAEPAHSTAPRVHVAPGPGPKSTEAETPPPDESPEVARVACPVQTERLDAAAKAYDAKEYDVALSCAEDELLDDPESAAAEQARGSALAALGRIDEARLAYTHALALDPDDPLILADAANLYLTRGDVTRELDEIALEYARRGERRARRRRPELVEELDLLQGMALNDLGRSQEAVTKLGEALEHDPSDLDARYEHAVALFELCRFAEAKTDLKRFLGEKPDDAYGHHQLGLTLERLGETRAAKAELDKSTMLDKEAFPPPLAVTMDEFKGMVDSAVSGLPKPLREDLGKVKLSVEEMPELADLTVDDPPLSPTILGLFRGEPIDTEDEESGEPRAILLYRRNLVRVAHTREELAKQVKVTLWHELGHLRGADDDQLRLRGLE
jgi:tetratricopeptide (TPR) repeat protein